MKELIMEWRHFAVEGETCARCSATGNSVREVVKTLSEELSGSGVSIRLLP